MYFLYYDIRVAVLIAVFYMFYRLLLSRDSLHQLNRFVLLGTAVASFVLPLCVITIHNTEVLQAMPATSGAVDGLAHANQLKVKPLWQTVLPIVFWAGTIITLLYTIVSISKVCILISRCDKHRQADGTVIAVCDGEVSPFSWMHYIVLSRSDYAHADRAILMHEREHVRQHHSWDVVLVDVLTSLQWFNPAMWMLRHDLRSIHEYEADAAVLSGGVDARQYQYLLVRKAMTAAGYSVVNGINHSTLKQRITMMNNKRHDKYSWLKALYILPVIAVSLMASAKTVTDYKFVKPARSVASAMKPLPQEAKADAQAAVDALTAKEVALGDTSGLSKALVVIDGKDANYSVLGDLNPSDIQSFTVFKGKEAIEKYGVKGAIVVTTKKAKGSKEENVVDESGVYLAPEQMPQFPGGSSELFKYIAANVRYPEAARKWGVEGRVVVSFIVDEHGAIADPKVVANLSKASATGDAAAGLESQGSDNEPSDEARKNGIAEGKAALDMEALRVVRAMPTWMPGQQTGKAVRTRYNVPMMFKLQ